jgi:hypothetical protein
MSTFDFHLLSAGVLAPGLASLSALRDACRQGRLPAQPEAMQLPAPDVLPANERRRASQVVRLALGCIKQAIDASDVDASTMRAVFATDEGTGEVCQQMLQALTGTAPVSPLLFANSVLNAPSGYFSIGWQCREPASVVSSGAESFAIGLMCAASDACLYRQPTLLVCYDPTMTSPLDEVVPIYHAIGSAWLISAATMPSAGALATFRLAIPDAGSPLESPWPAWLPSTWRTQAAAAGLAALSLIEESVGTTLPLRTGGRAALLTRVA